MKPVINLDQLAMETMDPVGPFAQQFGVIGERIGARKLGYNLTVCPPGKRGCPFHNHRINEEMFFILEGEGLLRFGDEEYPLRKHDLIACPPGGRDVAHQIINTGKVDLKYLALSTQQLEEIAEYPDSDKVGVFVGEYGSQDLRLLFRSGDAVGYFEGED
jgi:uncharacterized cupin superfamily protein